MIGRKTAQQKLAKVEARLQKIGELLKVLDAKSDAVNIRRDENVLSAALSESGEYSAAQSKKDLKAIADVEAEREGLHDERGVLEMAIVGLRDEIARETGATYAKEFEVAIGKRESIRRAMAPAASKIVADLRELSEIQNEIHNLEHRIKSSGAELPGIYAGMAFQPRSFLQAMEHFSKAILM